MNFKSVLGRTGLWVTLVIGVICAAFLLIISNEREPVGSTVASQDAPVHTNIIQGPDGPVIHNDSDSAGLKNENDSAPLTEALFSQTDKPTEMAANSTSPLEIAQNEQEDRQEEQSKSGEGLSFRRLSLQDEKGVIDPDGLRKAKQQIEAMKQAREQRRLQRQGELEQDGIAPNSWTWLGPGNIGGRIRSIAIQPGNANIMFVGSVSGGIWRTNNAGGVWFPVDDFMANLAVTTIVINPADNNIMFAGTGEGGFTNNTGIFTDLIQGAGIFRSGDQGVTWTQLAATNNANFNTVSRLAISPNGATILAGTSTGVWRSTDSGTNWTLIPSFAGNIQDVDFSPTNSLNAVAARRGFATYSTNGGVDWDFATFNPPITVGPTLATDGRVELAYAPSAPLTVYASVNNNDGDVYQSTDGGQNYTRVSTGTSYMNTGNGGQGFYDNIIWVNPLDANFVIVGGVTLQRSTNGGTNFSDISSGCNPISNHADQHFIVAPPTFNNTTNRTVFFANDGGIYRADDVATVCVSSPWTELNNNLGITQFYGVAGNRTSGIIIGGTQDNGTLRFNGGTETWTSMQGSDGGYCAADQTDPNYFYGETQNLGVVRSSDAGLNSTSINAGIADAPLGQTNFIAPLVIDPNEPNRLLAGGWSLWRTNDAKAAAPQWNSIKNPSAGNSPISAIEISPNNSDFVVVGHNNGDIYLNLNATTANPIPNWTKIDTLGLPDRMVTRLTWDTSRGPNWIYATFGGFSPNNVYVSRDLGASWIDITGTASTALPDVPVRSLVVHPIRPNVLYVGTEVGIFTSEDAGATWSLPQDGPANVSVDQLVWMGGSLVAATYGRGVYSSGQIFISNGGGAGGGGTGISCPMTGSGYWGDPLMWPGGHVPLATDDVAVVCPIKIGSPALVRNLRVNSILTINSSLTTVEDLANFGTIQPDISLPGNADIYCRNLVNSGNMNNIHAITASGDVVNGVTLNVNTIQSKGLRNPGALNAVNVGVLGDFDNSGTMIGTGGIAFTGGPTHNFQGAGQTTFPSGVIAGGQTVKFLTDMTFDIGNFNSNASTMDFNGKTLNFHGNDYSGGTNVLGPGTLRLAPTLGTVIVAGNAPGVNLVSGLASYQSVGTFGGPLTVDAGATFQLISTVTLTGDATVNGAITRGPLAGTINFYGETFTNNGGVAADWIRFNPSGPIPLSQNIVGSGVWSGDQIDVGQGSSATPSTVTLQNDVTFASNTILIGYTFNLNGHVLTYTGIGNQFGLGVGNFGSLAGPGLFKIQPLSGSPIIRSSASAARWGSELEIASGTVRTDTSFGSLVVTGPLTVDAGATLRLNGFGNDFRNNVVNNGTINMMNGSSALQFRGSSFTNNGSIDATTVYFLPLAAQMMDLAGSGTWTGAGTLYFDPLATTRFTTDVTYGSGTLQTYGSLQGVDPSIFSVPCTVPWTGPGDVTGNIRRTNLAACPGAAVSYGNPFTTITFNSGTPPSEVLVSAVSSPLVPPGFPNAVHRLFTITPTGGSGYTATLRLHYLDSELNGNNENTLQLFRNDGTNWNVQGATDRDTTNNWVEYAGVTQFSPWAFSSSNAGCTFSLNLASQNFVSDGGDGSVNVMSQSGCNWTAVSNDPGFIDITSGNSGTGNGTVNYTVSPNVGPARSGTISISGQTFTVNQDPGCSFSISPTGQAFSSVAGSDNIAVTSTCNWTAGSADSWITITSGASGTGDGTIAYSVAANPGVLRTGTITVTPAFGSPWIFSVSQGSSTPTCTAPPTGMVSWWPGADNANDISGTNHGTLENGVTFTTGQVGQAFALDGVNDSVLIPAINIGSAFTVEFWIYPTAAPGDYQHLLSNSYTSANYGALYFYDDHLEYYQNGIFRVDTTMGSIPLNAWTHVALAYDNSVDRLYVNGSLAATSIVHTETFNNQMRLGFTMGSPESLHFQGRLDEATLFGRALTIAEVQLLYLAGSAGKCQGVTPTPTDTPTSTPTATPTDTPTPTATGTPTATATSTPAVTVTSTPTPASSPVISGAVTYGNAAAPPKFISNVLVTGTGAPIVTTTTDAPGVTAGQYSLSGFGAGSYDVTLSKTAGQNNITSNDAARIAQHVAGISILNITQKVVSDVSNNGSVTSNDAALIARFVASLGAPFGNTGTWRFFVPPGPTFPAGSSATGRTYPSVTTDFTGEDYIGLLMGEVSGNWAPGSLRPANEPEVSTVVELPQMTASTDKEIIIPVSVQGATNKGIISYEFNLRYDPSVIQPWRDAVGVEGTVSRGLSVVTNASEPGLLRVVVYGPLPINENGVLLNLRFTALGAAGSVSPLIWEHILFNEGDPGTAVTDGSVELSAPLPNQEAS